MLALVWRVESVVVDVGRWTRALALVCRVEVCGKVDEGPSRSFEKRRVAVGRVGSTKALTLVGRA
jgi:hypothetical protein